MPVNQDGFIKPFSGYIQGEELAYVKTFSYFPGNPERFNRSTTSSMVILFDVETGLPACIMEAGWVTGLKTAASRFNLKKAYLFDILPDVALKCAQELEAELGFSVQAVLLENRKEAVRTSDILATVTTGDQPLFQRDWLKPGAFIARLGSYQEVALDVITGADKLIVDNWGYVSPRIPEIIQLVEEKKLGFEDIYAEWPDIVAGKHPGRESSEEVITYIALGIWGEYAAILPEVYRKAVSQGLGQKLPCSQK
jgi:ornithine cyclodeaminase/alanine dehydrogenase-like protein (mu-crystallin family)